MRIGLDGFSLVSPRTGVGHYTFELARELARLAPEHSFELVAPAEFPEAILAEINTFPNLRAVTIKSSLVGRQWWTLGLTRYARRARLDLFHGTNYQVPLRNRDRNVLTIHDLSVVNHPELHEPAVVRRTRRRLPTMIRNAAHIITPTEAVKREVCEQFKLDQRDVSVTPEAPRKSFQPVADDRTKEVRQRLGIQDDFILSVGTIEPRKNLVTLLRAFQEILAEKKHQPQLVIAGGPGWLTDEFDRFVAKANFGDRLWLTGYLHDDDLSALYSCCKLFVYPSIYEGFGLPPLEAMACGAAVVATRIPAIMENLDAYASLVEADDANGLAQTVVQLLDNDSERRRMAAAGREHAATFSWERTARMTLQVYEQVAHGSDHLTG